MPYFLNVGHFTENKGGLGARGYHAFRRGCVVQVAWGGIVIHRARLVQYHWAQATLYQRIRCSSPAAAIRKLRTLIDERLLGKGYVRLPAGRRIIRTAATPLGRQRR